MTESEQMELDCFRLLNTILFTATHIEPDDNVVVKVIQALAEMQAAAYESIQTKDESMSVYFFKVAQIKKSAETGMLQL